MDELANALLDVGECARRLAAAIDTLGQVADGDGTVRQRVKNRDTMSVDEVAAVLGICSHTAYQKLKDTGTLGPLTPIRVGRRIVFGRPQVEELLRGAPLAAAPNTETMSCHQG